LLDDHLENSAGKEVILEVNYIIYHRFSQKNTDNLKQVIVSFDCLHLAPSLRVCVKTPFVPKIYTGVSLRLNLRKIRFLSEKQDILKVVFPAKAGIQGEGHGWIPAERLQE